ncbi:MULTISPECIES: GNAT family N-acetyltransferase [unclassified Caballeronia]|uniref:GNAT family N-acetyltransferase n=1 Tax=unclassified Caballeronia TaxID=2646786 RepID=UPI0020282D14|nr:MULTISPECIES: GNAT family N-acetyltransferase [unclassified Caballeronia]
MEYKPRFSFSNTRPIDRKPSDKLVSMRVETTPIYVTEYETALSMVCANETYAPTVDQLDCADELASKIFSDNFLEQSADHQDLCSRYADFKMQSAQRGSDEFSLEKHNQLARQLFMDYAKLIGKQRMSMVHLTATRSPTLPVPVIEARKTQPLQMRDGRRVWAQKANSLDSGDLSTFLLALDHDSFATRFPCHSSDREKLACALLLSDPEKYGVSIVRDETADDKPIVSMADVAPYAAARLARISTQDGDYPLRAVPTCEASFVVASDYQNCGLGHQLFGLAMAEAKALGYEQMVALVAQTNVRMQAVLKRAGMKLAGTSEGGYVVMAMPIR